VDKGRLDAQLAGAPAADTGLRSILYPKDWHPGFQMKKNGRTYQLPDFSYAGYRQGNEPLPTGNFAPVITLDLTRDGSRDVSAALQQQIDKLAKSRERGILFVPEGTYRLDSEVKIAADGIVLRGAGPDKTKFILKSPEARFVIGYRDSLVYKSKDGWLLAKAVKLGDKWLEVKDATGLRAGQNIHIRFTITKEFADQHGGTEFWSARKVIDKTADNFRRVITKIEGNRIFVSAPLTYPLALEQSPKLMSIEGYTTESGLEDFGVNSAFKSVQEAWGAYTKKTGGMLSGAPVISIGSARDSWVRNIRTFEREGYTENLANHGIWIDRSFRITVQNVHFRKTQVKAEGGNGYLFILSFANEVLVKDSSGDQGRHNLTFLSEFGTSGNVLLRFKSSGGRVCSSLEKQLKNGCGTGPVDTHEPLAFSNLFDNCTIDDALQIGNRLTTSSNAGPTGAGNVMWATKGQGKIYSYNAGMGYVIGSPAKEQVLTTEAQDPKLSTNMGPDDFTEHLGASGRLDPQSLYEDQLHRRHQSGSKVSE
jgi:hypothetical protein